MNSHTCSRCGKKFEKTSTFKRHGYYCRSKTPGCNVSRKRSCRSCSQAKIRCDWTLDRCSNCKAKNIECQYANVSMRNRSTNMSVCPEDAYGQEQSLALSRSNEDIFNQADPDTLLSTDFGFDLDTKLDIFSPDDSLSGATLVDTLDLHGQRSPAPSFPSPFALDLSLCFRPDYPLKDLARSITRRRLARPQLQTHATLIIQILSSFPAMMLRKETFPPFIHPRSFSTVPGKEYNMPEALVNCMSLAQLFKMRTKENSRFLWKSIRMEHERLWREYTQYDDSELLAAGQALLIYILMRMVDGETEYNNFDIQLLVSLQNTAHALTDRLESGSFKYAPDEAHFSWHEWIFHESRRRIVVTVRVMDMLINVDHVICCQPIPGFTLLPLPAKKALWEAKSAEEWRAEFDVTLQTRDIFGLSTEGNLMKLQQEYKQITTHPAEWNEWYGPCSERFGRITVQPADWNEWYASSDRFGTLIMLALALH